MKKAFSYGHKINMENEIKTPWKGVIDCDISL